MRTTNDAGRPLAVSLSTRAPIFGDGPVARVSAERMPNAAAATASVAQARLLQRRSSVSSKPRSHGGMSTSATAVSGAGRTRTCFGVGSGSGSGLGLGPAAAEAAPARDDAGLGLGDVADGLESLPARARARSTSCATGSGLRLGLRLGLEPESAGSARPPGTTGSSSTTSATAGCFVVPPVSSISISGSGTIGSANAAQPLPSSAERSLLLVDLGCLEEREGARSTARPSASHLLGDRDSVDAGSLDLVRLVDASRTRSSAST